MKCAVFQKEQYDLIIEKTPKQSLAFGRHIYLLQQHDKLYWLKYQDIGGHTQYIAGFEKEMATYQQNSSAPFILPYQVLYSDSTQKHPNMLRTVHSDPALPKITTLSLEQIQQRLLEILRCIAAFHRMGLVHGDLKPSHLRFYQNNIKLLDFEQVQSLAVSSCDTPLNATPRYMAPELFHLEPKSQQTDLYALGIIVFEWLNQSSIQVKNYQDWAVFHCQTSSFQLPKPYHLFQKFLDDLLARQKAQRFLTAEQAIQFLI